MDKLKALFEQAGLPTDFAPKASVLFEAAVNEAVEARLKVEVKRIQEAAEDNLEQAKDEWIKESEEDVDKFLDKAVQEWCEKNSAALTGHIKANLAESIMTKLRSVLESEGCEMPEEKETAIKEAEEEVEQLKEELEDTKDELKEAKRKLIEFTKSEIITEATRGMTRVSADRIRSLAEATTFKSVKQFARSVATIAEALTGKKLGLKEDLADQNVDGDKPGGQARNKPANEPAAKVNESDDDLDNDDNKDGKDGQDDDDKNPLEERKYFKESEGDEDDESKVNEGKKKGLKEDEEDKGVDKIDEQDDGDKNKTYKEKEDVLKEARELDIVALTMRSLKG